MLILQPGDERGWSFDPANLLRGRLPRTLVRRRPACGHRIRHVEQHGVDLADPAVLDREELAHQAIGGRRGTLALRTGLQTEAQDREHDAALFIYHRVATIPEVAAEEPAFIEAARRVVLAAVAHYRRAGCVHAVLDAIRIRGEPRAVVRGRAVRLERAPVAFGRADEVVVRIAFGFTYRERQPRRHRGQTVRIPQCSRVTFVALDAVDLADRAVDHLQAQHHHGLGAVCIAQHGLRAGIATLR